VGTGEDAKMSDAIVTRYAEACPNLAHISRNGGIKLTDESLFAVFE